jgi:hypothetical protein
VPPIWLAQNQYSLRCILKHLSFFMIRRCRKSLTLVLMMPSWSAAPRVGALIFLMCLCTVCVISILLFAAHQVF